MKVFYTAHASESLYDIMRAMVPPGMTLVTLDRNSDPERYAKIADCEIAIQANATFPASLVAAAPKLQLVIHQGVGYHDTVDLAALKGRGIRLALTADGTAESVAEHTVLLTLAVCRHLVFADKELRQGRFHRHDLRPTSPELTGRTIGYVGMGRIAQAAAERFKAFGTQGIYTNRSGPLPPARERELGVSYRTFDDILRLSDVLTLHVPLGPDTAGMIDAAAIAKMKSGAILINTARGGLIDEQALCEALRSEHLLGAGIDAFAVEPVSPDHPLCALNNVVLTPHYSGGTSDAFRRKMQAIFTNAARFRDGLPLNNEVELP